MIDRGHCPERLDLFCSVTSAVNALWSFKRSEMKCMDDMLIYLSCMTPRTDSRKDAERNIKHSEESNVGRMVSAVGENLSFLNPGMNSLPRRCKAQDRMCT